MGLREILCCVPEVECMCVGVSPPLRLLQEQSSTLMCSNARWWFFSRSPLSHMSTTGAGKRCFGKLFCFVVWMLRTRFFSKDARSETGDRTADTAHILWEDLIHLEKEQGVNLKYHYSVSHHLDSFYKSTFGVSDVINTVLVCSAMEQQLADW